MKNILLLLAFYLAFSSTASCQIQNSSYEAWRTDTTIWGYTPYVATDTFPYTHPVGWTTINSVSENRNINRRLAFKDSTAKFGTYNLRLTSDSFTLHVQGLNVNATLPGIAINGEFPVDLTNFISGIQGPANVKGAGQPISSVKKKFRAWVKYNPVIAGKDSMLIWITLRKGSTVVAEAKLTHGDTDTGYVMLEQDFVYKSCMTPDTVVVFLASANPNFSNLLASLTSGLQVGTTARIDSIELVDFAAGEHFGPIANTDITSTYQDSSINIVVLSNDSDCYANIKEVNIAVAPLHGRVTVQTDKSITYYSDSTFTGRDSFYYNAIDTFGSGKGLVVVTIDFKPVGIADVQNASLQLYPNPTTGMLVLETPIGEKRQATIYNSIGAALIQRDLTTEKTAIDLSGYGNGIYLLVLRNKEGKLLASTKIAVLR